ERGVKIHDSVPPIIVSPRLNHARTEWQHSLRSFERLNLRLFVHTDNERSSRRSQVEADDVFHLLDELRVATDLERLLKVWLQIVRSQNVVNCRVPEPDFLRQHSCRPLRVPRRWRSLDLADHQSHQFL